MLGYQIVHDWSSEVDYETIHADFESENDSRLSTLGMPIPWV